MFQDCFLFVPGSPPEKGSHQSFVKQSCCRDSSQTVFHSWTEGQQNLVSVSHASGIRHCRAMVPLSLAPDHQGALFRCHTVYPLTQVLSQDILPFFDNFIHTQQDHKHSQFPLSLIILLPTPLFSNSPLPTSMSPLCMPGPVWVATTAVCFIECPLYP